MAYPRRDSCLRNDSYGWHFQYLAIIGLALATIVFFLGSLADVTSSYRLAHYKNAVSVVATPLEVIISILYVGLVSVDKELVIRLPDISLHAVPSILLTIDYLILSPPWTISSSQSLTWSTALAFTYWIWVEQCYRNNGWYPYPVFDALTTPWRVVLFAFSGLLMAGSTASLNFVYGALNGVDRKRTIK
ncbi:MAG: hypothetical protein Q9211_006558 [Gyalolechia sp. 1 TL-2023]